MQKSPKRHSLSFLLSHSPSLNRTANSWSSESLMGVNTAFDPSSQLWSQFKQWGPLWWPEWPRCSTPSPLFYSPFPSVPFYVEQFPNLTMCSWSLSSIWSPSTFLCPLFCSFSCPSSCQPLCLCLFFSLRCHSRAFILPDSFMLEALSLNVSPQGLPQVLFKSLVGTITVDLTTLFYFLNGFVHPPKFPLLWFVSLFNVCISLQNPVLHHHRHSVFSPLLPRAVGTNHIYCMKDLQSFCHPQSMTAPFGSQKAYSTCGN